MRYNRRVIIGLLCGCTGTILVKLLVLPVIIRAQNTLAIVITIISISSLPKERGWQELDTSGIQSNNALIFFLLYTLGFRDIQGRLESSLCVKNAH